MMRRMRAGGAPGPGRRALLAGVLTSPVLLAGCGIRLEEDAPPVPLVPTREPLPGEDALTALTRACAELADRAEAVPGADAGALVPVHRRQHTVLRTTLVRLGVPVEVVDGAPSPAAVTPSPSASPSAGATPGAKAARTALGEVEGDAALGVRGFTDIAEELGDTVLSLHAQRFAAAVLLTGSGPDVTGGPVTSGIVGQLAGRTEGARYFLQVVAARSSGRARTRATTTLSALDQILSEQVSEGSAPPGSLGVPLPFEVETAADATRLARRALGELRGAYGPRLGALREEHGADGWAATTRWLGAVEAECHRWGLTLQPFPGLT
jgi:hypothetical protein